MMLENIIILGAMIEAIGLLILWSGTLGDHKTAADLKEGEEK